MNLLQKAFPNRNISRLQATARTFGLWQERLQYGPIGKKIPSLQKALLYILGIMKWA